MHDAVIVNQLLERYRADKEGGGTQSLEAYQALFPGYEELIAREFADLKRREAAQDDDEADQLLLAPFTPRSKERRIGPYLVLREIARGGQATVYLAEDARLNREVALKVLEPGHGIDTGRLDRFRREAEITSKLNNSGICPVFETGEDRGVLWIAMAYVDGEPLSAKIATARNHAVSQSTRPRSPTRAEGGSGWSVVEIPDSSSRGETEPPPRQEAEPPTGPKTWTEIARVLRFFEEAARVMHVAHDQGVLHRDIKPGNIMVTKDGLPVILDFGLAQDVGRDLPTLTLTGDFLGTPAYMSPEQLMAQRSALDRRTDVYSLGVSLFECLALRRPFEAPTREALHQAILTREPSDLRSLNPSIPFDLRVVVATAIEKDRNRRYQTALDFAEELHRVRTHEPILAKPVGPFVRLRRWAQRNPALATALGGLFAVLVAGLAVALFLLGQRNRALTEKSAALTDYDRLGDSSRLDALRAEADRLWPCEAALVPAMTSWVNRASLLEERLAGHQAVLARLRLRAKTPAPESRDAQSQPMQSRPAEGPRFEDPAEQFKYDTTAKLVADLTKFADPDPSKGLLADVRARLAFAASVEGRTITAYQDDWRRAIDAIEANPKYLGLRIKPQLGLIPIGEDPKSHLWEFVHLQTAAPSSQPIPKRNGEGHVVVTEDMGIVFVLLPGGTFRMGAVKELSEKSSPINSPNVDPDAEPQGESPVREVTLDPFFLSKYEMTQGQWLRVVGRNPSVYVSGLEFVGKSVDLRNPVEQVSWNDCDLWLGRLGLVLPTEAQWEYGARGGTTTPRWTGPGTAGLDKAENLADQHCKSFVGVSNPTYAAWNDGYALHAPVGSFNANPFGLHDVLGNLTETCLDWRGNYELEPRAGDGLRSPLTTFRSRVARGGNFIEDVVYARSAARSNFSSEFRGNFLGVRPARAVVHD